MYMSAKVPISNEFVRKFMTQYFLAVILLRGLIRDFHLIYFVFRVKLDLRSALRFLFLAFLSLLSFYNSYCNSY